MSNLSVPGNGTGLFFVGGKHFLSTYFIKNVNMSHSNALCLFNFSLKKNAKTNISCCVNFVSIVNDCFCNSTESICAPAFTPYNMDGNLTFVKHKHVVKYMRISEDI